MAIQIDRRNGTDRRQHHVVSERAFERRQGFDHRAPPMMENEQPGVNRVLVEDYWGAAEENSTAE